MIRIRCVPGSIAPPTHCRLVMLYLWQQLPVRECQLDELWSFVHTKDEHLPWAKTYRDTYGDAWVWVAFAPEWRLVVAFVVGKRTQAEANLLLERVAYVTTDLIPFFTSDQLPEYRTALLHVYGKWYQPPRRGTRGPPLIHGAFPPKSCAMPKWSRRANGVTWWRSTTTSCLETLNALPRSWPRYRRVRRSIPALSNERIWRFANIIVD